MKDLEDVADEDCVPDELPEAQAFSAKRRRAIDGRGSASTCHQRGSTKALIHLGGVVEVDAAEADA